HLFDGAHSRRNNDRLALAPRMPQQVVVGKRRRRDLIARRTELIDEIYASWIPTGGKPGHFHFAAVAVDQAVAVVPQFQAALQIAIGRTERILARLGQLFRCVDYVDGSLLKLHGVASRRHSHADQTPAEVEIAVVVDSDLGDHVRGGSGSHHPVPEFYRFGLHTLDHFSSCFFPSIQSTPGCDSTIQNRCDGTYLWRGWLASHCGADALVRGRPPSRPLQLCRRLIPSTPQRDEGVPRRRGGLPHSHREAPCT